MDTHKVRLDMLNLFEEGNPVPLCSFEKFESGKALDWLTAEGYCVIHKETFPYMFWILRKL